jgi:hypothetical protein
MMPSKKTVGKRPQDANVPPTCAQSSVLLEELVIGIDGILKEDGLGRPPM